MRKIFFITLSLLIVPFASGQINSTNENLRFGLPMDGKASDEVFLANPYFVASYSLEKHQSNWVAWQLSDEDYNQSVERQARFNSDPFLRTWNGATSLCETILEPRT